MTAKKEKPWTPEKDEKYELVNTGNVGVKLYRRERTTAKGEVRIVYEVADFSTGTRRMHGFTKLAKARAKAAKLAADLAAGESTAASMRNGDAASFGRATEILRPTGLSLELAASIVAKSYTLVGDRILEACQRFAEHGAETITPRTVQEAVDEVIAHKEGRKKSDRYIGDLRARLRRFAKSFQENISSVTTAEVQAWLDGLKVAPRTAKNFRGALGTLFSFAEARGYLIKNPVADTEQIETNGDDGAIEIYTPKELAKLLEHAPARFLPLVAIGAFAGLRSAEAERLEWQDIDLAGGFIHVAACKAKTPSRRLVPVLPNLCNWLAPIAKKRGPVWKGSARDLLDARAETVKASGVKWKDNGLRHSFCSYRLAQIQDAAKVALEAGNSPNMIFRHYRELVKPAAAVAFFAIEPPGKAGGENVINLNSARA